MPLRPCLGSRAHPAGHTLTYGNRCPECRRATQQAKDARRPERRTYAEIQRRRQAVAAHVATYGWVCPGDAPDHPPHPSTDLTADHIHPVATGAPETGPLRVLCRTRNSQRAATTS